MSHKGLSNLGAVMAFETLFLMFLESELVESRKTPRYLISSEIGTGSPRAAPAWHRGHLRTKLEDGE